MIISRISIKNWRNFRTIDTPLSERQFIVGPNASGKSNFLDVFRFLRDIAKSDGGGLQKAVQTRGGISKIRCLAARRDPDIEIDASLSGDEDSSSASWRYSIGIRQEQRGFRQPLLSHERVWRNGRLLLDRPDNDDKKDEERLKQTHLEQVSANKAFREVARFFEAITYLHLVPQLLRHPELSQGSRLENDPFGQGFLERVAKATQKTQLARLKKIEEALKIAVPQLEQLKFERDSTTGQPHLLALYSHWRPNAGWQSEEQFSDGTLRLIGLLWSLFEGQSPLLLEEPELSLNDGVTRHLPGIIRRLQRSRRRQTIISTHSEALLNDEGIGGNEILMLFPSKEGTAAKLATDDRDLASLLDAGLPPGDVVLAKARAKGVEQLGLFE